MSKQYPEAGYPKAVMLRDLVRQWCAPYPASGIVGMTPEMIARHVIHDMQLDQPVFPSETGQTPMERDGYTRDDLKRAAKVEQDRILESRAEHAAEIGSRIAELEARMAPLLELLKVIHDDDAEIDEKLSQSLDEAQSEIVPLHWELTQLRACVSEPFPERTPDMSDMEWLDVVGLRHHPAARNVSDAELEYLEQQCADFVANNPPSAVSMQFEQLQRDYRTARNVRWTGTPEDAA